MLHNVPLDENRCLIFQATRQHFMSMWCAVAYSKAFSVLYCLHNCAAVFSLARGHNNPWVDGTHLYAFTQAHSALSSSWHVFIFSKVGHVAVFCYKEATHVWVKATYLSRVMWSPWCALVLCDDPSGWATWSQVGHSPGPGFYSHQCWFLFLCHLSEVTSWSEVTARYLKAINLSFVV